MRFLSFDDTAGKPYLKAIFTYPRVSIEETNDFTTVIDFLRATQFDAAIFVMNFERTADLSMLKRCIEIKSARMPVIIIGQNLTENLRIRLWDMGVHDIIDDNTAAPEIYARVMSAIRRLGGHNERVLTFNDVTIDTDAQRVMVRGVNVNLTGKEYLLVQTLALRPGVVQDKTKIIDRIYDGFREPDSKTIDVFVCKIRKTMNLHGIPNFITTSWGRGYMIEPTAGKYMGQDAEMERSAEI